MIDELTNSHIGIVNRQSSIVNPMVERAELITVCRQIGGMMEAGVDILRITRVLRAQTENPRLLELYDALDHDLTMGRSLADAVERAPDVFSPFAVSLVQQGEANNDLAGAFLRFAEFLQQEDATATESPESAPHRAPNQRAQDASGATSDFGVRRPDAQNAQSDWRAAGDASPLVALDELLSRLQAAGRRALSLLAWLLAWLLLALAAVGWMAEAGWLERRWLGVALPGVAALFCAATGAWLQRRIENERLLKNQRRGARDAFGGHGQANSANLESASNEAAAGAPGVTGTPLRNAPPSSASAMKSEMNTVKSHTGLNGSRKSRHNGQPAARPASSYSEEDYE